MVKCKECKWCDLVAMNSDFLGLCVAPIPSCAAEVIEEDCDEDLSMMTVCKDRDRDCACFEKSEEKP